MSTPGYLVVDAQSSGPQAMARFLASPEHHAAREARAGVADFDMLLVEAY